MSKTRARVVRLYTFTCDECGLIVEHQAEGSYSKPLREPIVERPQGMAFSDTYANDPALAQKGMAWRGMVLNQAIRDRKEGFVCSDECAVAWAGKAAPLPMPAAGEGGV